MGDQTSQSFGQILRKAREDRGLTPRDLAESTRIRLPYLEALEAENWSALPGGVIGRGFVRSVAQQLGLCAEDLLAEYRAARGVEQMAPPRPLPKAEMEVEIDEGGRGARPALFGFLFLLGAALGIWLWSPWTSRPLSPIESSTSEPRARPSEPPRAAAEEAGSPKAQTQPPASAEAAAQIKAPPPPREPTAPAAPESAPPKPGAPAAVTPGSGAVFAAPSPTEPVPAHPVPGPVPEVLRLEIQAVERTWVRAVSDSGQPQERILGPGEHLVMEARDHFALKLGNAGGVRLFWNGEPLKVPGRPGQVASFSLPESLESLRP